MDSSNPFAEIMSGLRVGDQDAATEVFRRFYRRLLALASSRFDSWLCGRADPEDVVQSACMSFFLRCQRGQFDLTDWDDLCWLLTLITLRKCSHRREQLLAERRHAGREVPLDEETSESWGGWETLDRQPTPPEAAMLAETIELLLRGFSPPDREIVEQILQGYTAEEIAERLDCSERTVRRVRARAKIHLRRL